jgi:hypothetical protein
VRCSSILNSIFPSVLSDSAHHDDDCPGSEERILEVAKAIIDRERESRPAPIARMRSYLRKTVIILAFASLLMSLIAVSVRSVFSFSSLVRTSIIKQVLTTSLSPNCRMGVTAAIRPEWPWLFLTRNLYLLLPVLPVSFRLVTRFIYSMQNAKMLTLFQVEVRFGLSLSLSRSLSFFHGPLGARRSFIDLHVFGPVLAITSQEEKGRGNGSLTG